MNSRRYQAQRQRQLDVKLGQLGRGQRTDVVLQKVLVNGEQLVEKHN